MHLFGVHTHLFRGSPAAVAAAVVRHGLRCVQLTPSFPCLPFHDPGQITAARCRQISQAFHDAGVTVACLTGGVQLLEPDLDRRHRRILRFRKLIRHCHDLGTDYIVAEVGGAIPPGPAAPPTREAWAELCVILHEALRLAADHSVTLLLKPGPGQVALTVDDAVRLREEVAWPQLGFVLDAAAFLLHSRPGELDRDLDRLCERLGPWAPVVHAKDLRFEPDGAVVPRLGRGVLDYGRLLSQLRPYQPTAPVILEHLRTDEVTLAKAHLEAALAL